MSYMEVLSNALDWEDCHSSSEILCAMDWLFEKGEDDLYQNLGVDLLDKMYKVSTVY